MARNSGNPPLNEHRTICPVCFGTGYAARYTASRDVPSPAVVGTTGHLSLLGPEHVCPNCKGAGRV